ncbi:MAG: hypothetical protein ACJ76B_04505 [Solirubrobacterales bacterium]
MKSTMEPPDTRPDKNSADEARPPIVMERRHLFGNRLRWAAQVIREERMQRRNKQQKLF